MTSVPIPIVCIYNLSSLCFMVMVVSSWALFFGDYTKEVAFVWTWMIILFFVDQLILGPLYYFVTKQEKPREFGDSGITPQML